MAGGFVAVRITGAIGEAAGSGRWWACSAFRRCAEVIAAVDFNIIRVTGEIATSVKSLGLSLVWAIYASIGLAFGIWRRSKYVRLGSLALLAVPIVKLFLIDSFALDPAPRIAAFLSLGLILLIAGFLYQKYSATIKGFLFE